MKNEPRRFYVFTINNPTDDDYKKLQNLTLLPNCSYIIVAKEFGQNMVEHLQGYAEFRPAIRWNRIMKFLPRSHLELRMGTAEQARNYCMKDNDFTEYGVFTPSKQGARTDLENIRLRLQEGDSDLDIADSHFGQWVRYHKSFRMYRSLITVKRSFKTKVIVIWGETCTYKSARVHNDCPDIHKMYKENNFWSNYNGESHVLWDDFEDHWCKRMEFLQLTDRYSHQIRQLGTYVNWAPKVIYITSNTDPTYWYGGDEAILRRLDEVIYSKDEPAYTQYASIFDKMSDD